MIPVMGTDGGWSKNNWNSWKSWSGGNSPRTIPHARFFEGVEVVSERFDWRLGCCTAFSGVFMVSEKVFEEFLDVFSLTG